MVLVGYSDSEGSDSEAAPAPPKPAAAKASKSAAPKLVDPAAPRKIKIDLPKKAQEEKPEDDRPAKRVRTGGAFGGFNALLPAPKRAAETAKKPGLNARVNLQTSAAAAFSREPVNTSETSMEQNGTDNEDSGDHRTSSVAATTSETPQQPAAEMKTVGNAMRFKPLSVANKKKPKRSAIPAQAQAEAAKAPATTPTATEARAPAPAPPPPKPKVSLFSIAQDQDESAPSESTDVYQPLMSEDAKADSTSSAQPIQTQQHFAPTNSLDSLASDLNLSASERRALFGRNAKGSMKGSNINIAHFNMDAEYAKNEELRAAGETVEHRAVKSIAPGKHSLQQLVNAASTQRDALQDKWAEGKRNRGEAGNKYGWGN